MNQLGIKSKLIFPAVCFITALLSFLPFLISGRGIYLAADDFNAQAFPFLFAMHRAVRGGIDSWAWNLDLGTSAIQGFGFYGLGSPFTWICLLLPETALPYAIGPVFVLKYVVAAFTARGFLKRFTKYEGVAMTGALLYAFSGFQTVNMMYHHFHDVTAFFPLLLTGVEKMISPRNKDEYRTGRLFFAFAVFLNCMVNYVFFIQNVIITVLYYLIRYDWNHRRHIAVKDMLQCILYGVLGVGMAAALFVPSVYYIMGNPRSDTGFLHYPLLYGWRNLLFLAKGILLPGEAMTDHSSVLLHETHSGSAYLPFVGLTPVIAYLIRKRDWLFRILVLCLVCAVSPLLSAGFMLFTVDYQRWWLFPVLMMALACMRVIEEKDDYPLGKATLIHIIMILVFAIAVSVLRDEHGNSLIYHRTRLYGLVFITITTTVLFYVMIKKKQTRNVEIILAGCICITAIVTSIQMQRNLRNADDVSAKGWMEIYETSRNLPETEDSYRYRNSSNMLIMSSGRENTAALDSYSSTTSNALMRFDGLFDYWVKDHSMDKNRIAGLPELLGGRYLVEGLSTMEQIGEATITSGSVVNTVKTGGGEYKILSFPASPIGYRVDHVITEETFRLLPVELRGIALLDAPVVSEENVFLPETVSIRTEDEIYSMIAADPLHNEENTLFSHQELRTLSERNQKHQVRGFTRNAKGFFCETDYREDALVFFSILNDEGWNLTIDGMKSQPIDAGGLMLLYVPGGKHRIEGVYHTPWFRESTVPTVIAWGMFCVLATRDALRRRNEIGNVEIF